MALDISADVQPISPEQPQPLPVEAPVPAETPETDLPDEVLRIPSIQAIMAGAPPAVSFNVKNASKTEEAKLIAKNKSPLEQSGIQFYRSLAGDTGVMFNALKISGEDIIAADKAGKLLEIAPPVEAVSASILKSGAGHPALQAPNSATGAPSGAVPPQAAQMPQTPSSAQSRQRLAAQLKNLQPQAPTAGAKPGAGRLLNSIMRPVL